MYHDIASSFNEQTVTNAAKILRMELPDKLEPTFLARLLFSCLPERAINI